MECSRLFLFFSVVLWGFLVLGTYQLQPSQTQVLLQLRKQLEYPKPLEIWNNDYSDLCYLAPSSQMNVTCENNFVSELRIIGDKHERARGYNGFAVSYFTLSQNFSMDSLVATLSRLTSLKVLSLVSLGLWGPIPDKIFRLNSLEHLDLSWNYLYGSVPVTMSRMVKLQSLDLDGNFINGSFPDWFDSLSNLSILSLKSNMLNGKFHASVAKIATLSYIGLSNNGISGELPDFSSLDSLKMLELCNNQLDSELPGLPEGLVTASLCNNSFSGEIPQRYSQLNQLQQLDLSDNNLEGSLPAALFALPSISYLNLSSNKLSGFFPGRFRCGSELGQVDIANNRLRGQLPSCLSALSGSDKVVKVDGNCLMANVRKGQHPETFCVEEEQVEEEEERKSKKRITLGVLVGVIIAIVVLLSILAIGFLVLCRTYCPRGSSEQHLLHKAVQDSSGAQFPSELLMNARFAPETSTLGAEGIPAHRLFSFEELKEATNNFDKLNLMGEGSTGKIFRGELQNSGMRVAVRCLRVSKKYTMRNFKIRLDLLAKLRHPNLVCLLGHCLNEEEKSYPGASKVFLVYEYVSSGTFRAHLSENDQEKILKWSDRLAILTSIAKAVHFLHTGVIPGFFSNRLKANNVLINEHGIAKLSDYGLSIIQEEIDTREVNAEGLKTWQMKSLEDDIYSFGALMLESIARSSVSLRTDAFLIDQMASFEGRQDDQKQLLDNTVLDSSSRESLSIVISITRKCISLESGSRPSFEDILWNLQYASQVQANAHNGDHRVGMQLH